MTSSLACCLRVGRLALPAACCVLLLACSGGTSAGNDTPVSDGNLDQAGSDVPAEAVRDAAADPGARTDPAADAAFDAAPEADLLDTGADADRLGVSPESADDASPDVFPDAPADVSPDAPPDAASDSADAGPGPCAACAAYGPPVAAGTIGAADLVELSGLGSSRIHPGVFYAHADAGDSARFFAFDLDGTPRGEFHLAPGAVARDWEDLAMGPCDAGWCLYIGDIGDNQENRSSYTIYVVPEPLDLDTALPVEVAFTTLPFHYPDGPHNSETLLVHPQTGDVYTVRKGSSTWDVYKLPTPHTPGQEAVLEKVGKVPSPGPSAVATGGDIHPCGTRVLLRSYGQLVELRLGAGQAFDAIFSNAGVPVPVAGESQGEAVAYDADGLGYLTVSEGAGAVIHHVVCTP